MNGDLVLSAYEAYDKKQLRRLLLAEWRCARGCLLIHVWQSPQGPLFYLPRYKQSRERNTERSVPSARAKNTLDGDRIWKPRAGELVALEEFGATVGMDIQCDHLDPQVFTGAELLGLISDTPGRPLRRVVSGS
ncbi:hypothetical protein NOCA2210014 [metagenome]|uniref:Uncharacterized protein n=1 Tax=metagenome TaxID=256318 RepID=A0A2P2BY41_9ZZZZ